MTAPPAAANGNGPAGSPANSTKSGPPDWRRHWVSALVFVIGLGVTAALIWLTSAVDAHNQARLLQLQVNQAAAVIGEEVPTIRGPLDTTVAIADVTGGNVARVAAYVGRDVGPGHRRLFASLSLWRLGTGPPTELTRLGGPAKLRVTSPKLAAALAAARGPGTLAVTGLLNGPNPRLGFSVASAGAPHRYAVYAEVSVPRRRGAYVPHTSAFDDLNFALYLGRTPTPAGLIEATVPAPLTRHTESATTGFGNTTFDLVASAKRPLGDRILAVLPWVIGALGVGLTAAALVTAEWLIRRRNRAERQATQSRRLYTEQRSIATSLQTALLSKELPAVGGIDLTARYVAGDPRIDIGGDWYDVIAGDDHTFLFAVGDVSGRGVPAAKTMATLHYAIRAYAAQGDGPAAIVEKLGRLVDVGRDGQFATVLVGHVDVDRHELTLVNAGHLPPLVIAGGEGGFARVRPGRPVGVDAEGPRGPVTVRVPPSSTVLCYTDGLVERRGEHLEESLERLRRAAAGHDTAPGHLIDAVVTALTAEKPSDDIALLELRWRD